MGDEAIHQGHCTRYACVYGDPQCPTMETDLPGGRAERALAVLREPVDTELTSEFAVRNQSDGWVYALPRLIPKFLYGKRGTREAAEWHLRQIAGPDPEDWTGFEIIERPVGSWKVSD